MIRYEIRLRVQGILRNPRISKVDIDEAINAVLADLNLPSRLRFHQGASDITLATGTFVYSVPTGVYTEELMIFAPYTSEQIVVSPTKSLFEVFKLKLQAGSAGKPSEYIRRGQEFWIYPTPSSSENSKTLRVYGWKDVQPITGDLAEPGIPARYHYPVVAMGAAAYMAPATLVQTAAGTISVAQAYQQNLRIMREAEAYEPYSEDAWIQDERFSNVGRWGSVEGISEA